jgi:antitoxin component of MazEF toxin-antitoxin module
MKTTPATVIKTGNSYALRVPKSYAERNNLLQGSKVMLPDPQVAGGTLANLQSAIKAAKRKGWVNAWDKIADPVQWQRSERSDWS